MRIRVGGLLLGGVGVLAFATSGAAAPAAGITVSARPPIAAIIGSGDMNSVVAVVVVAATFSPEVLHDDARVTGVSTRGLVGGGFGSWTGRDEGNVLHSTAVYQGPVGVLRGDRILIVAKWNAYNVGGGDGTATASNVLQVPKREPAPRLRSDRKERFAAIATKRYAMCAGHGTAAVAIPGAGPWAMTLAAMNCAAAGFAHDASLDPVDLNFRVVAKPKTPPAPKVAAGEGVSSAAAAALNKLLQVQSQEIGLGRAMVTAFNRSQGAHVKKQTEWEKKQVRAAGRYAAQLSSLMLAEAKLRPSVRRALTASVEVTEEQAYAFQDSLIARSLPIRLASDLSRLGLTKAELKEVRDQLIVRNHPTQYDGNVLAAIADPLHLSLLRQVAADLRGFSRDAARDPLTTGQ